MGIADATFSNIHGRCMAAMVMTRCKNPPACGFFPVSYDWVSPLHSQLC